MSADFVGSSGGGLSLATPGVSQGIGLATSIIMSQLAQHTARLTDATDENDAVDQVVPAFDADLAAIQAAYEEGSASAAECMEAAIQVDQNIYNYLLKQVGKPGTAWAVPSNLNNVPCNKTCTVGCCIYYGDLRPAIYGATEFAGGLVGLIPVLKGSGGQPSTGHTNGVYVPEIYPGSYSSYTRAAYWLDFTPPPKRVNVAQQVLTVTGVNVNVAPASPAPAPSTVTPAAVKVSPSSALGLLENANVSTIIGVVGGILLIATLLFGASVTRVNK